MENLMGVGQEGAAVMPASANVTAANHNLTASMYRIEDKVRWLVLYGLCIAAILVGNITLIVGVVGKGSLRASPVDAYLLSLVTARTIIGIFIVPAKVTGLFSEMFLGSIFCRFCQFAGHTSVVASIFSTCAIAVAKYREVLLKDTSASSGRRTCFGVCVIWTLALLYAMRSPVMHDLVFSEEAETIEARWKCTVAPSFGRTNIYFLFADLLVLFVAPLGVIITCNQRVIRRLRAVGAEAKSKMADGQRVVECRAGQCSEPGSSVSDYANTSAAVIEIVTKCQASNKGRQTMRPNQPVSLSQTTTAAGAGVEQAESQRHQADSERHQADSQRHQTDSKRHQALRAIQMILTVSLLFTVCTLAPFPLQIYAYFWLGSLPADLAEWERWVFLISYSNAWINAAVIFYFRPDIRCRRRHPV